MRVDSYGEFAHNAPPNIIFLLLCVIQPLLYGAATRLPLVFIGVHAREVLRAPWATVGVIIGTFQLARAVSNSLIAKFGAAAGHIFGASAGLIGYCFIGYSPRFEDNQMKVFWAGAVMVGLSEVIASMQDYVKREYEGQGLAALRHRLRVQYAWNVLGTAIGFGCGGYLYRQGGVPAAAQLGIMLECGELLALAAYVASKGSWPSDPSVAKKKRASLVTLDAYGTIATHSSNEDFASGYNRSSANGNHEYKAVSVNEEGRIHDEINAATAVPLDARPTWMNYALAVTFGVQALMIGAVLSTGPLYLSLTHDVDIAYTGYIFAAGEAVGTFFLFLILIYSDPHQLQRNPCMPEPFNIIIMIAAIGAAAIGTASPHKATAITAVMFIMGINDCATSATAECQGTTVSVRHYRKMNTLANMLRRMGNTVTAFTGPMLFALGPQLPFALFGTLMLCWAALLVVLFNLRARQVWPIAQQELSSTVGKTGDEPGLMLYWRAAPLIEMECAYHRAQCGKAGRV